MKKKKSYIKGFKKLSKKDGHSILFTFFAIETFRIKSVTLPSIDRGSKFFYNNFEIEILWVFCF